MTVEGGRRDLVLGVLLMLSVGLIAGLFFVGAFTVARWIWGTA